MRRSATRSSWTTRARNDDVVPSQMMGMPCIKRGGKMVAGFTRTRWCSSCPTRTRTPERSLSKARTVRPVRQGQPFKEWVVVPEAHAAEWETLRRSTRSGPLAEPAAGFLVPEDARVLARLEHEVEVAAVERVLRPPAVDDAPLLAHDRDRLAVDPHRQSPTGLASTSAGRGALSRAIRPAARTAPVLRESATTAPPPRRRRPSPSRCWRAPGAARRSGVR